MIREGWEDMEIPTGTYKLRKTGTLPDGSFNVDYAYVYATSYADLQSITKHHDAAMASEGLTERTITCDLKLVTSFFYM